MPINNNNMIYFDFKGVVMLTITWFLNIKSYLTKDNITFWLGTVATIIVIIYNVIRIVKETKKKKDDQINKDS